NDALDGGRYTFLDEHSTAFQLSSVRLAGSRKFIDICRKQMVGNDVPQYAEPIDRQSRKNLTLVWNQGRQDYVEGRDPIARAQQKFAPKIINTADLPLVEERKPRQCIIDHRLEFSYLRWI